MILQSVESAWNWSERHSKRGSKRNCLRVLKKSFEKFLFQILFLEVVVELWVVDIHEECFFENHVN
jgi:hypothetical protein